MTEITCSLTPLCSFAAGARREIPREFHLGTRVRARPSDKPAPRALRDSFPLHFRVFKQIACHLPHEANVEQVFSRAGLLFEPGMGPEFLANLVMISINKKAYKPSIEKIKDKYYAMFRGKGGEGMEDEVEDASNRA